MFKKLLIANRGEIACRIIKTARRLGIQTVAVYSKVDQNSLHASLADEAYLIGPPPATQSYLNRDKIIEIAHQTESDAIHPGYGFLAEDPIFAEFCHRNHIVFIGPSSEAIAAMGDKRQAKELMTKAGVATVPGYQERHQDLKTLSQHAKQIGFPLLVKAAAGGGGKGMRLVNKASELASALQAAQSEAKSSFADDTIFLEKYIEPARHVEVQIFTDQQENGVYLFDRDCSIQRRHQKIIEEAPAPQLKDSTRKKMGETAIKAAKAINYLGAGTIEFLVDNNEKFYFMEMNTRLQVEHPVTEMITHTDLVEWQLRVAAGEPLPLQQKQLKSQGHAFEARIYAENPGNNFTPSTGKLIYFSLPAEQDDVRIDTGVHQNDIISPYYDPLLAKLIVWSKDRSSALHLLQQSLRRCMIVGNDNNINFLQQICANRDFQGANLATTFVESQQWQHHTETLPDETMIAAAFAKRSWQQQQGQNYADYSQDCFSPWFKRDYWRLDSDGIESFQFWHNDKQSVITINKDSFTCHNKQFTVTGNCIDNYCYTLTINRKEITATVVPHDNQLHVFYDGHHYILDSHDPKQASTSDAVSDNRFIAPMPGTIIEILVKPKQTVKKGDRLLVLEAMKMAHTITAASDGTVKSIHHQVGDLIEEGAELLTLE